ncbi:hypothetical protein [Colwellia sp. UCD-KL20]|uniref:hypothetical protein n=1 Tax=Colwellia sp. UCD-KL20 TaxID=1917165 RepID=UPI0009705984|nr:hypothetical protein [Colwellia sp. UCD-KL20]
MESRTILRFKEEMIKEMPFFPNTKEVKDELLSQKVFNVLFHFLHWKLRFIPTRSRKIIISPYVTADKRWSAIKEQINTLANKAKEGNDLTPYLSTLVHSKGYTPRERIINKEADSWDDKDRILNSMGFHHLHLGTSINNGMAERTDEVIFVKVTRKEFHIIGIFDHSVFDDNSCDSNELTLERNRLWKIYEEFSSFGLPEGSVYISNMITASGHPAYIHDIVREYMNVIEYVEPKIKDKEFVNSLYKNTELEQPKKNKLRWYLNGIDLGLIDQKNNLMVFREAHV